MKFFLLSDNILLFIIIFAISLIVYCGLLKLFGRGFVIEGAIFVLVLALLAISIVIGISMENAISKAQEKKNKTEPAPPPMEYEGICGDVLRLP